MPLRLRVQGHPVAATLAIVSAIPTLELYASLRWTCLGKEYPSYNELLSPSPEPFKFVSR